LTFVRTDLKRIQMEILGLSTSPSSGGAYALILNEIDGNRRLPIIIGTFEAQAIALELEHIKPPRPMTHDLIKSVVLGLNSWVKHIVINELRDGTFFAEIICENEGSEVAIDSRPSDAIAIAIRFDAAIFVEESVLNDAGITAEATSSEEQDQEKEEVEPILSTIENPSHDSSDPLDELNKSLSSAIADEDYERAARIRDEIQRLKDRLGK
jgi:bifunctional DNase/RNase